MRPGELHACNRTRSSGRVRLGSSGVPRPIRKSVSWPRSSPRRRSLPTDWPKTRLRILDRDGWRCRWITDDGERCPARATDVDHIGDSNDHADSNLRALCEPHHDRRSSLQGNTARWSKGRMARPTERHPGIVG